MINIFLDHLGIPPSGPPYTAQGYLGIQPIVNLLLASTAFQHGTLIRLLRLVLYSQYTSRCKQLKAHLHRLQPTVTNTNLPATNGT